MNVTVLPPSMLFVLNSPLSAVTVCANGSSFLTVTVAPAFTGFTSEKAVPEIVMSALPDEEDDDDLLLLLQAARPTASATTAMRA